MHYRQLLCQLLQKFKWLLLAMAKSMCSSKWDVCCWSTWWWIFSITKSMMTKVGFLRNHYCSVLSPAITISSSTLIHHPSFLALQQKDDLPTTDLFSRLPYLLPNFLRATLTKIRPAASNNYIIWWQLQIDLLPCLLYQRYKYISVRTNRELMFTQEKISCLWRVY